MSRKIYLVGLIIIVVTGLSNHNNQNSSSNQLMNNIKKVYLKVDINTSEILEFKEMKTKDIIIDNKKHNIYYQEIIEENKTYLEYEKQSFIISGVNIFE